MGEDGLGVRVRQLSGSGDTWIYLIGGEDGQAPEVSGAVCAVMEVPDWNRDLTPWPEPALGKRGEPFGGGAEAFLGELLETIAALERGRTVRRRCIAGYSLAGLFSLWAVTRTDAFEAAASMSGSLWYEGFADYLRTAPVRASRVYISLGEREPKSRNPRMARVGVCTDEVCGILDARGIPCRRATEPGGHFDGVEERILRGCRFLAQGTQAPD